MRDRLEHIDKLDKFQSQDEPEFSKWTDTRLDRWLVDWALRTGKEKTATKLAREKGIEVHFSLGCCYLLHSESKILSETRGH